MLKNDKKQQCCLQSLHQMMILWSGMFLFCVVLFCLVALFFCLSPEILPDPRDITWWRLCWWHKLLLFFAAEKCTRSYSYTYENTHIHNTHVYLVICTSYLSIYLSIYLWGTINLIFISEENEYIYIYILECVYVVCVCVCVCVCARAHLKPIYMCLCFILLWCRTNNSMIL